ncbi:MAG: hypothetical protein R2722_12275 [Tessaracoccus sp.]
MLFLETLPGWPEAPEMSSLFLLMLTVIGPLIVCAFIGALVWAPHWARRSRQSESTEVAVKTDE